MRLDNSFEHPIHYGVATISRLLKIIGLLCRICSLLYGSFAKETYNFKEPTNRIHIIVYICVYTGCIQQKNMEWQRLVRLKKKLPGLICKRSQILDFMLLFCKRDLCIDRFSTL